jgi:hypothetical protein
VGIPVAHTVHPPSIAVKNCTVSAPFLHQKQHVFWHAPCPSMTYARPEPNWCNFAATFRNPGPVFPHLRPSADQIPFLSCRVPAGSTMFDKPQNPNKIAISEPPHLNRYRYFQGVDGSNMHFTPDSIDSCRVAGSSRGVWGYAAGQVFSPQPSALSL